MSNTPLRHLKELYTLKSSTCNQQTLLQLDIRADKRFDALVKKEMQEHQHLISCHNKEMQALRDQLCISMERFESLFQKSEQDLRDFKTYTVSLMGVLKVKIEAHEATIFEQRKSIEDLSKQLLSFQDVYSTKDEIEKVKKGIEGKVETVTVSHITSFQDFQRDLRASLNALNDNLTKLRCDMDKKFSELQEKGESNFQLSRLDKEGIEKDFIRYKNVIFYIEKKIENLYTLIERINKRGELCRKPE
jgi:hypothetical protein